MEMPLIITDADGRLLYKSRSVDTGGFLSAWKNSVGRFHRDRTVFACGRAYRKKEVSLGGKRYFFFFDYEELGKRFDTAAKDIADALFDIDKTAGDKRDVKIITLVDLFVDRFSKSIYSDGIRVSFNNLLHTDIAVHVSPNAFVLCLSLMVRLAAAHGRIVRLSFANECGRVTVYCDGTGDEQVDFPAFEAFEFLLYEVAAASGFALEKTEGGGKVGYSLSLEPLDISLFGFKFPQSDMHTKISQCYLEMLL